MKRVADRAALSLMRLLPRRVAGHLLQLLRQNPALTDAWGYHIRPIHYYEPLPDFQLVTRAQLQRRRAPMGVVFDMAEQSRRIKDLAARYGLELRTLADQGAFPFANEYFAGYDAALYYAIIRDLRPSRIIEIGAGYSTRIAAKAIEANARDGAVGGLTVIEPYPQPRLTEAGLTMELVVKPVQQVDSAVFASLQRNDIVFIDSSHAVRTGSDVVFEFAEILPALNSGVWVHIHDIFFPLDYPPQWVIDQRLAFNEQYLLEAFLAFNQAYRVAFANFWLATEHADALSRLLPEEAVPAGMAPPASFWMRRE